MYIFTHIYSTLTAARLTPSAWASMFSWWAYCFSPTRLGDSVLRVVCFELYQELTNRNVIGGCCCVSPGVWALNLVAGVGVMSRLSAGH